MVTSAEYVPERGDVIWISLNPRTGHEQSGRRPAIVISPVEYNRRTGLAILCPITSQVKGYPFEVRLKDGLQVTGVVLSDHVKNLDWRARRAEFLCRAPHDVLNDVADRLARLILE